MGFEEAKQFQKLQTVIFCKYIKNIVHVFRFDSNLAGDKCSISLNQFAAHGTEKQLSWGLMHGKLRCSTHENASYFLLAQDKCSGF